MTNKLHETDETSPQNNNGDNNSVIGVEESTMKMIVIVLGVLLLIGFVVVVGTIVYRVVNLPDDPGINSEISAYEVVQTNNSVAIGNIEVEKPKDSKLKSFNVEEGLIYLYFESSLGTESIKIVRLRDGLVVGRVGFIENND